MAHKDNVLYSGQTSVSRRERQQDKRTAIETQKNEVRPYAQSLVAHVEAEKQRIASEVLEYVKSDTSTEDLKSTLMALRMYDGYLTQLSMKLGVILRHKPKKVAETENE